MSAPATRRLAAYGRTVSITAPGGLVEFMLGGLPPTYEPVDAPVERGWSIEPTEDGRWEMHVDGVLRSVHAEAERAAEALLSDLELWVADHARDAVFIHAGCVALDGRAIVLPGYSMAGKTSLTMGLVTAGAHYFSDEYAVIGPDGLVSPYPRPLSVRSPGASRGARVRLEELGGTVGEGQAALSLVAFLRYSPEHGWATAPMTRARGTIELLTQTVCARSQPVAALHAVTHASTTTRFLSGTRDEAGEAAGRLLELLG